MSERLRLYDSDFDGGPPYTNSRGPVETPQRVRDQVGSLQIQIGTTVGSCATIHIEGRIHAALGDDGDDPNDNMPFTLLESSDESEMDDTRTFVKSVRVWPNMRVTVVDGDADPVRVWLLQ